MMKFAMVFCVLLIGGAVQAQELTCLDKLLPFSRYSGLHMLTRAEWNDGKDYLDPDNAKAALNSLTGSKLMCRQGELVIKVHPVCQPVIADIPQSNVCYLHTNLGYFVISRDNGRNVNFIFSKDKLFSIGL